MKLNYEGTPEEFARHINMDSEQFNTGLLLALLNSPVHKEKILDELCAKVLEELKDIMPEDVLYDIFVREVVQEVARKSADDIRAILKERHGL